MWTWLRFVDVGKGEKELQTILNFESSGLKYYGAMGSNRKIWNCKFFYEGRKNINNMCFTGGSAKLRAEMWDRSFFEIDLFLFRWIVFLFCSRQVSWVCSSVFQLQINILAGLKCGLCLVLWDSDFSSLIHISVAR